MTKHISGILNEKPSLLLFDYETLCCSSASDDIEIPDKFINLFSTAIYSEDLAGYEVTQVPDKPNQFFIRRKFIAF